MTSGQRAAMKRAINRFAAAVEEKAFDGTIPWDCEAAEAEHDRIDQEFARSREFLEKLIERYAA